MAFYIQMTAQDSAMSNKDDWQKWGSAVCEHVCVCVCEMMEGESEILTECLRQWESAFSTDKSTEIQLIFKLLNYF